MLYATSATALFTSQRHKLSRRVSLLTVFQSLQPLELCPREEGDPRDGRDRGAHDHRYNVHIDDSTRGDAAGASTSRRSPFPRRSDLTRDIGPRRASRIPSDARQLPYPWDWLTPRVLRTSDRSADDFGHRQAHTNSSIWVSCSPVLQRKSRMVSTTWAVRQCEVA